MSGTHRPFRIEVAVGQAEGDDPGEESWAERVGAGPKRPDRRLGARTQAKRAVAEMARSEQSPQDLGPLAERQGEAASSAWAAPSPATFPRALSEELERVSSSIRRVVRLRRSPSPRPKLRRSGPRCGRSRPRKGGPHATALMVTRGWIGPLSVRWNGRHARWADEQQLALYRESCAMPRAWPSLVARGVAVPSAAHRARRRLRLNRDRSVAKPGGFVHHPGHRTCVVPGHALGRRRSRPPRRPPRPEAGRPSRRPRAGPSGAGLRPPVGRRRVDLAATGPGVARPVASVAADAVARAQTAGPVRCGLEGVSPDLCT